MVQSNLPEKLIFFTRAGLRKRLQEEVSLAGNGLVNGRNYIKIQQQRRARREAFAKVQVDHAQGGHDGGKRNAVDLPRRRNHRQAVLYRVRVDLEHGHGVAPEAQIRGGRVGFVDLFQHIRDVPQAKRLGFHGGYVAGNGSHKAPRLVNRRVRGRLCVHSVDEGEFDIAGHLLELRGHLKVQFIDGIGLLICNIQAGQSAHIGLLCVRNANGFLENLGDVGLLFTGGHSGVRGGQGSRLADGRLCAVASCGVLLTGDELDVIGGFRTGTDDAGKGHAGVSTVEEHTGIVQYAKAGCECIRHKKSSLLRFRLDFRTCQPGIVSGSGIVATGLRVLNLLLEVLAGGSAAGRPAGCLTQFLR